MNIGEASAASGVSAKMIRYYESVALIRPAGRSAAGYRLYGERDVQTLRFLRRARNLGFSLDQMRELLALWRDEKRASADVKCLALAHVTALDAKAREIAEMSSALRHLAERCEGDYRPDCPIIDDLAAVMGPDGQRPSAPSTGNGRRPASLSSFRYGTVPDGRRVARTAHSTAPKGAMFHAEPIRRDACVPELPENDTVKVGDRGK